MSSYAIKICCNYRADKGWVFLEYYPKGERVPWWRRARREVVNRRGWQKRIIKCAHCNRPATRLDHHWPWMSGANKCDLHKNAPILD